MIYLVDEFKVIYCKFCKRKPKKNYRKICKKCAVREISNSLADSLDGKIHFYQ